MRISRIQVEQDRVEVVRAFTKCTLSLVVIGAHAPSPLHAPLLAQVLHLHTMFECLFLNNNNKPPTTRYCTPHPRTSTQETNSVWYLLTRGRNCPSTRTSSLHQSNCNVSASKARLKRDPLPHLQHRTSSQPPTMNNFPSQPQGRPVPL